MSKITLAAVIIFIIGCAIGLGISALYNTSSATPQVPTPRDVASTVTPTPRVKPTIKEDPPEPTFTPVPTATDTPDSTLTPTATPTITETPPPTPTATDTPYPTAMPSLTPTSVAITPSIPAPPALPYGHICVANVQNITSPRDLTIYDGQQYLDLIGDANWPDPTDGINFQKYEIFYYDPDSQFKDMVEKSIPVTNGTLHEEDIRRLVRANGKFGWYTFGVLGVRTDSNHFPLGTNNQGCFVRVYLPWPR